MIRMVNNEFTINSIFREFNIISLGITTINHHERITTMNARDNNGMFKPFTISVLGINMALYDGIISHGTVTMCPPVYIC